jgi:chromosome segregation ATPase
MRVATLLVSAALMCCVFPVTASPQQTTPPPQQDDSSKKQDKEKKVWTNDDLKRLPDTVNVAGQPAATSSAAEQNAATPENPNTASPNAAKQSSGPAQDAATEYLKQIAPLRQELADIDQRLNIIRQGEKNGAGASDAVSLTNVPTGVDTQGEIEVLQKRRAQIAADIDNLETEAQRNGIPPGDLRKELPPEELATQAAAGTEQPANEAEKNPEVIKAEKEIAAEQQHLEMATKELDLLRRELNLDQQTVYSNPNYSTTGSGNSELDLKRTQIDDKQSEIEQTERKIDDMRAQLRDLEMNPPSTPGEEKQPPASAEPTAKKEAQEQDEHGEAYWRKRFADMRAKLHLAETERDVLQRELNVLQVQYDPDPQKAMIEQNTRGSINEHTDEIAAKDKEIADLKQQLADLEDELRRAGGEPGWARE